MQDRAGKTAVAEPELVAAGAAWPRIQLAGEAASGCMRANGYGGSRVAEWAMFAVARELSPPIADSPESDRRAKPLWPLLSELWLEHLKDTSALVCARA